LKKKKQKNFWLLEVVATPVSTPAISRSFLLLFFKKEVLAFPCLPRRDKMDCFAPLAMTGWVSGMRRAVKEAVHRWNGE
jgi:hypothetical protein